MLDIRSITKSFDDSVVLDTVSLSVHREIVALVGHNGSGKSTLFNIITGELEPDSGSVSSTEVIGYLPQHFDFGNKTVSLWGPMDKTLMDIRNVEDYLSKREM